MPQTESSSSQLATERPTALAEHGGTLGWLMFWLRSIRLLNIARFARSIAQGALVTDFALYLRSLGWSGTAIGTLLATALVFSMFTTIVGAIASDRFGRKAFVIAHDSTYALACLVTGLSNSTTVLVVCTVLAGFGRGSNGTAGPFAAVERAWLTQGEDKRAWALALSINSTMGFLGMAIGATLAALPSVFPNAATGAPDYHLCFLIASAASSVSLLCQIFTKDRHEEVIARQRPTDDATEKQILKSENRDLRRLALVNLLRGAGIGVVGPLTSYWFAVRFNVGPESIGPMRAVGFLLAAIASQIAGTLGMKYGMMAVTVRLRLLQVLGIAALPLSPNFTTAIIIYWILNTLDRSSNGPRAAITANLVRNKRRGFAGVVAAISQRITRSVGPVVSGFMFDAGMLATPFLIGACFQAAYLYLYQRSFRDKDPVLAASSAVPAQPGSNEMAPRQVTARRLADG